MQHGRAGLGTIVFDMTCDEGEHLLDRYRRKHLFAIATPGGQGSAKFAHDGLLAVKHRVDPVQRLGQVIFFVDAPVLFDSGQQVGA